MAKVILFNKPFNVLSQFTDKGTEASQRKTLSEFIDMVQSNSCEFTFIRIEKNNTKLKKLRI